MSSPENKLTIQTTFTYTLPDRTIQLTNQDISAEHSCALISNLRDEDADQIMGRRWNVNPVWNLEAVTTCLTESYKQNYGIVLVDNKPLDAVNWENNFTGLSNGRHTIVVSQNLRHYLAACKNDAKSRHGEARNGNVANYNPTNLIKSGDAVLGTDLKLSTLLQINGRPIPNFPNILISDDHCDPNLLLQHCQSTPQNPALFIDVQANEKSPFAAALNIPKDKLKLSGEGLRETHNSEKGYYFYDAYRADRTNVRNFVDSTFQDLPPNSPKDTPRVSNLPESEKEITDSIVMLLQKHPDAKNIVVKCVEGKDRSPTFAFLYTVAWLYQHRGIKLNPTQFDELKFAIEIQNGPISNLAFLDKLCTLHQDTDKFLEHYYGQLAPLRQAQASSTATAVSPTPANPEPATAPAPSREEFILYPPKNPTLVTFPIHRSPPTATATPSAAPAAAAAKPVPAVQSTRPNVTISYSCEGYKPTEPGKPDVETGEIELRSYLIISLANKDASTVDALMKRLAEMSCEPSKISDVTIKVFINRKVDESNPGLAIGETIKLISNTLKGDLMFDPNIARDLQEGALDKMSGLKDFVEDAGITEEVKTTENLSEFKDVIEALPPDYASHVAEFVDIVDALRMIEEHNERQIAAAQKRAANAPPKPVKDPNVQTEVSIYRYYFQPEGTKHGTHPQIELSLTQPDSELIRRLKTALASHGLDQLFSPPGTQFLRVTCDEKTEHSIAQAIKVISSELEKSPKVPFQLSADLSSELLQRSPKPVADGQPPAAGVPAATASLQAVQPESVKNSNIPTEVTIGYVCEHDANLRTNNSYIDLKLSATDAGILGRLRISGCIFEEIDKGKRIRIWCGSEHLPSITEVIADVCSELDKNPRVPYKFSSSLRGELENGAQVKLGTADLSKIMGKIDDGIQRGVTTGAEFWNIEETLAAIKLYEVKRPHDAAVTFQPPVDRRIPLEPLPTKTAQAASPQPQGAAVPKTSPTNVNTSSTPTFVRIGYRCEDTNGDRILRSYINCDLSAKDPDVFRRLILAGYSCSTRDEGRHIRIECGAAPDHSIADAIAEVCSQLEKNPKVFFMFVDGIDSDLVRGAKIRLGANNGLENINDVIRARIQDGNSQGSEFWNIGATLAAIKSSQLNRTQGMGATFQPPPAGEPIPAMVARPGVSGQSAAQGKSASSPAPGGETNGASDMKPVLHATVGKMRLQSETHDHHVSDTPPAKKIEHPIFEDIRLAILRLEGELDIKHVMNRTRKETKLSGLKQLDTDLRGEPLSRYAGIVENIEQTHKGISKGIFSRRTRKLLEKVKDLTPKPDEPSSGGRRHRRRGK